MKIIGRTSGGYIAEISEGDIAALVGERFFDPRNPSENLAAAFARQKQWDDNRLNLIGASIDLAGRFRRVTDVEQRHSELGKTAESLRLLATALDAVAAAPLTLPKGE